MRAHLLLLASLAAPVEHPGGHPYLDWLPQPLLRPGPRGLLWWQWLALLVLIAISLVLGALLGRLTRALLARVASRTAVTWDDELVQRLAGPIWAGWALLVFYLLVPVLSLSDKPEHLVARALQACTFAAFFWALLRMVEVGGHLVADRIRAQGNVAFQPLVALGVRSTKVVVLALAVVAVLSELGYPVASLIAGLGVGGLAVALAAQKTVENLFGAFSIAVDQPFREGDFVKIEDFVGTVEIIGLRSSRFRTLDRTLITIPNGKLAETRVESYAVRDRLRLSCTLGLVYDTSAAQMRQILAGLERVLREEPRLWPEGLSVRFASMGESSLNVEVMAWFQTTDWNEFTLLRQELLLKFMEVVQAAGSDFAFPTRTVLLPGGAPGSAAARIRSE